MMNYNKAAKISPSHALPGPVDAGKRILFIDSLRGIAIWGVLVSDMIGFSSPEIHFAPSVLWTDSISRTVSLLLDILVSEKFITIFAVLFGIGFAIQMERAAKLELNSSVTYKRRLLFLLLIGLFHGLFIWAGDILTTYAILGFLLLLFRKRSQKTILWWAVSLQCIIFLLSILTLNGKQLPQILELQKTIELYGHSSWGAIQQARTQDFLQRHLISLPILIPFIFPRFLFGLWLWRSGFLLNLNKFRPFLRKLCFWGLVLGLTGETVTAVYSMGDMGPLRVVSIPLLAAAYASGVALLFLSGALPCLFRSFAAIGRTSLSNYLFQRILCTTLFFSYGFGFFGSLSPLTCFVISNLLFAFEFAISVWWMNRFQFGPMEWIWRSITYLHPQAWKISVPENIVQNEECSEVLN
jgi:uncharacterized protein